MKEDIADIAPMATAAKLARDEIIVVEDGVPRSFPRVVNQCPELSVAEEYAQLTGEEIFAASQETSNQYNGIVLAKAIVIVQTRLRCSSINELGRRAGLSRSAIGRHAMGRPMANHNFHRCMRDLAILLDEEGGRR